MKQLIVYTIMIFCFSACQDIDRPEKPDGFIKEERFKDILYDISLVNAARDFSRAQLLSSGIEPDTFIYEKYGIDSLQLAENIAYYSVDFSRYQKIWEAVNKRIESKRKEVDSLVRRQDSIEELEGRDQTDEEVPRTGLMHPDDLKQYDQD